MQTLLIALCHAVPRVSFDQQSYTTTEDNIVTIVCFWIDVTFGDRDSFIEVTLTTRDSTATGMQHFSIFISARGTW